MLQIIDNAIPDEWVRHLCKAFSPASPFWPEHRYDDPATGYFSYHFQVAGPNARPPQHSVEELIATHIWPTVRKFWPRKAAEGRDRSAARARMLLTSPGTGTGTVNAEWWVHSRDKVTGHQMHYDTEEGLLYASHEVRPPATHALSQNISKIESTHVTILLCVHARLGRLRCTSSPDNSLRD